MGWTTDTITQMNFISCGVKETLHEIFHLFAVLQQSKTDLCLKNAQTMVIAEEYS